MTLKGSDGDDVKMGNVYKAKRYHKRYLSGCFVRLPGIKRAEMVQNYGVVCALAKHNWNCNKTI